MKYQIAIVQKLKKIYTYFCESQLLVGQIVTVDLRGRECCGVVLGKSIDEYAGATKNIVAILPYRLHSKYIQFAEFVSAYNLSHIGDVFKLLLPFGVEKILLPESNIKHISFDKNVKQMMPNNLQQEAFSKMQKYLDVFRVMLLHGITGSGKTAVFLEFAKKIVELGKQILILVPEVSLSMELAKNVAEKFQIEVYIWHNSVSPSKKLAIWKKAINGDHIAIVGARSALFVPFANLGCIIVDEEHDKSFKQNEGVIYNARDMGIYLASCFSIPVVLSSATPSVESYNNAKNGKYEYITLKSRYFQNATLPDVCIDDLKQHKNATVLSERSIAEIDSCLKLKKQVLIFVNRRGYAPKVLCRQCGGKVGCPACSSWLCFHFHSNRMVCHYCGFQTTAKTTCAYCQSDKITEIGVGIEKVYEEVKNLFPTKRILSLSSDTMTTPKKIDEAIKKINNLEVDIILGTQIVAKGHNFHNLNLVVVTCVDLMLYGDDFRLTEKAFQLLHQVSGRAGRVCVEKNNAKVIIQTYNPDDELLKMLQSNDTEQIYAMEIKNRMLMTMPPFGRLVAIVLSALSEKDVFDFAKKFIQAAPVAPRGPKIQILGPVQPSIFKMRSRYRLRILVVSKQHLQEYIKTWLSNVKVPNAIRLAVDVDPYDFF